MFVWNKEKIGFYRRAAEFTDYNNEMAGKILDCIGENREIWDLGCGMSQLSLSLAARSKSITCVDISREILVSLESIIEDRSIGNIRTVNKDFKEFLEGSPRADCIIVSHFLDMYEYLDYLIKKSRTLVVVKNSIERKSKSVNPNKKQTIEEVEENILKKSYPGLAYEKIIHKGDFGQPLRSLEEAQVYCDLYSKGSLTRDRIEKNLVVTGDPDYPYYYPKDKTVGILIIEGNYGGL